MGLPSSGEPAIGAGSIKMVAALGRSQTCRLLPMVLENLCAREIHGSTYDLAWHLVSAWSRNSTPRPMSTRRHAVSRLTKFERLIGSEAPRAQRRPRKGERGIELYTLSFSLSTMEFPGAVTIE